MIAELRRKSTERRSKDSIDATVPNDYRHSNSVDDTYNKDNNYYDNVLDDYEMSSDRLTIMKVTYL